MFFLQWWRKVDLVEMLQIKRIIKRHPYSYAMVMRIRVFL